MRLLRTLTFPNLGTYQIQDYNILPRKSLPSAPIHSFGDGADGIPIKAMSVSVRAVQDLHGYANPWPKGGSKNTLDPSEIAGTQSGVTFTVNANGTVTVGGSFSSTVYRYITNTIALTAGSTYTVSGVYGSKRIRIREYDSGNNVIETTEFSSNGNITINANTVKCDVYLVVYGISSDNVLSLMICLSTATDPTVFAPYANLCPIVGWTQAQVVGSGVNVWDEEWEEGNIDWSTGNKSAGANRIRSKNYIPVKGGESYYFYHPSSYCNYFLYDKDKTHISSVYSGGTGGVITIPSNAYYVRFATYDTYGATYNHDISINYPSTDTSYHAYNGRIVTIVFKDAQGNPMIAYGGSLIDKGGLEWEFTPTHGFVTLNGSEGISWTHNTYGSDNSKHLFYRAAIDVLPNAKIPPNYATAADLICNEAMNVSRDNANIVGYDAVCIQGGNPYPFMIWFNATGGITTSAELNTWLSNNPMQVRYELTEQTPITLTADAEVVTEYGDNVLYADCGNSDLTYRQDIGLVIGGE